MEAFIGIEALSGTERLVLALRGRQFLRLERSADLMSWPEVVSWLRWLQPEAAWTETTARRTLDSVRSRYGRASNAYAADLDMSVDRTEHNDLLLLGRLLVLGQLTPADLRLLMW